MSFWGELKRRNVYKVGVAYAIVAWLLIQFSAIAFPHLGFPSWAVPFVIIIFIIGFPLALLLAWAYEVTPEGIKRTKEVPLSESITHLTGKKLNYILAGLLVLAVTYILFNKYYLEPRMIETKQVAVSSNIVKEAKKTIAVLPFVNLSSDPEQEYFVDGLSEEILNCLAQIPDLTVIARTSSFSFKGNNKPVQEIASVLGVENLLEGSVRKAGNALRITAQLVKAVDGSHLWSETYDRELKDIFAVQQDIATAVASELKAKLGVGRAPKQSGGTDNVEAYECYLIAQGLWNRTMGGDNLYTMVQRALRSIDSAIEIDPEFALAWARKATIHQYLTIFAPANGAAAERDAGLNAALRAIELDPNLASGYFSLGFIKTNRGDWIDAESAYRIALELKTENLSGAEIAIVAYHETLGYIKKAQEFLDEMIQNDPLNLEVRGHYLNNFGILGDMLRAEKEYDRGKMLFGDQWLWGDVSITFLRLATSDIGNSNDVLYSDQFFDMAKEYLNSPQIGVEELRRLYASNSNLSTFNLMEISWWAAHFGDPEFALDLIEKVLNVDHSSGFIMWWPVMKEVRQLPRFKKFVKEIGLVDYWNKFGWPDICHELDNGDFECD